jgi:hypothetical protein
MWVLELEADCWKAMEGKGAHSMSTNPSRGVDLDINSEEDNRNVRSGTIWRRR